VASSTVHGSSCRALRAMGCVEGYLLCLVA
jgi:hypothetical protein